MIKHCRPLIFVILISVLLSSCSYQKNAILPSLSPTATKTQTPTITPEPTKTKNPTATIMIKPTFVPTDRSNRMRAIIDDLFDKQIISTTDGRYLKLDNFDESWAQLFWYQWHLTGYKPTNFVIQADVAWDSASTIANWSDSGCGFVYHESGEADHFATFLMMDGYVVSIRNHKDLLVKLTSGYAEKFKTPSDHAHIVLVVENQYVTVFVNEKKVVQFQDSKLNGGNLGLTLASGTNKGFGTHCSMRNIELWVLPDGETLPRIGYNHPGNTILPGIFIYL